MAFFNVMKPGDFFYEKTPDGFDLKKKIKAEDDYYEDKISPVGKDNQEEQGGGFYSSITPTRGGQTSKPFRPNKITEVSSEHDNSYGSLVDAAYVDR